MTLLVLERGATWPGWAASLRNRADHAAVEVQAEDESMAEFETRVMARLARLQQQRVRLRSAGYACAPSGTTTTQVRRRICETLLALLDGEAQPELIIGAGDWDAHSLERAELMQIWSDLSHFRPRTTVSVVFEPRENKPPVSRAAPLYRPERSAQPSHIRHTPPSNYPMRDVYGPKADTAS